jgi:hypothetical protein
MMIFLSTVIVALMATTLKTATATNLEFTRDGYSIEVNGNQNVPKYTFTAAADTNTTYKIMFQKIYETDASGKKVGRPVSLPSLTWAFEPDVADLSVFWIRNTEVSGKGSSLPWTKLEFKNRLFNDMVKFDVILDGYQWSSVDATALNFAWKFSATTDEDEEEEELPEESDPGLAPDAGAEPTEVCFGNGIMCFDIAKTADITNPTTGAVTVVDVALSFDGTEGVTVSYKRFVGNLYHDPSFGFVAEDDGECEGIIGAIICFFASIFFCF